MDYALAILPQIYGTGDTGPQIPRTTPAEDIAAILPPFVPGGRDETLPKPVLGGCIDWRPVEIAGREILRYPAPGPEIVDCLADIGIGVGLAIIGLIAIVAFFMSTQRGE